MNDEKLVYPEQASEKSGGKTGRLQGATDDAIVYAGAKRGDGNRGHRAGITKAGEVVGSGAGAGGGGGPEDFDSDPASGGGKSELSSADRPETDHGNRNT